MGTSRKSPGRPPLPEGTAREIPVTVKLSAADVTLADALAARFGGSRASILRRALHAVALKPNLLREPARRTVVIDGGRKGEPITLMVNPEREKLR